MDILNEYLKQNTKALNSIEEAIANQRKADWLIAAMYEITDFSKNAEEIVSKAFENFDNLTDEEEKLIKKAIDLIIKTQQKEK